MAKPNISDKTEKKKTAKAKSIRTRFAPSPTGFLHIGSARTALFNYLFAKKNNGTFILRVEDTDKERSKPEFEKDILEGLGWLGIKWDEGPYRQSERTEIYKSYLSKLLNERKAYYCFCAADELEVKRQKQISQGQTPKYDGKCAGLSAAEVKKNQEQNKKSVIRLKTTEKNIAFEDAVRGKVEFNAGFLGDFVIAKNLEAPLFYLAGVIDDYEMEITHVIRGEDHISNTPKQILIQEALGFPRVVYAHLPLILGQDRSKLSKRHGAVATTEYRKQGYLPEALINFLAFLGWNPGDEREIMSLSDLIENFSLEKVHKGGAIFNINKLDFINSAYIRNKTPDDLAHLCLPYLKQDSSLSNKEPDIEYLKKVVSIYQERLKRVSELPELANFFFKEELSFDKNLLKWKDSDEKTIKLILENLEAILSDIEEKKWTKENLEKNLLQKAEKTAKDLGHPGDRGYLLWPFRVALTGQKSSAGPFEIAEILGKETSMQRIKKAKDLLV